MSTVVFVDRGLDEALPASLPGAELVRRAARRPCRPRTRARSVAAGRRRVLSRARTASPSCTPAPPADASRSCPIVPGAGLAAAPPCPCSPPLRRRRRCGPHARRCDPRARRCDPASPVGGARALRRGRCRARCCCGCSISTTCCSRGARWPWARSRPTPSWRSSCGLGSPRRRSSRWPWSRPARSFCGPSAGAHRAGRQRRPGERLPGAGRLPGRDPEHLTQRPSGVFRRREGARRLKAAAPFASFLLGALPLGSAYCWS